MLIKKITENEEQLIKSLCELIEKVSNDSITKHNEFRVGFSGGSLVKFLTRGLQNIKTDFTKWKIFFCDERVVPTESADSTYGVYRKELKDVINEKQYIPILQGVSAQEAAVHYNDKLIEVFGETLPKFDMLLLGVGPDGHTCSLFPNHELLQESTRWVAPITDSPKPPPERITLTLPVVNNARYCVFATGGEGKADIVKRILEDKEDLPATRVDPPHGELCWFLDRDAAKHVN